MQAELSEWIDRPLIGLPIGDAGRSSAASFITAKRARNLGDDSSTRATDHAETRGLVVNEAMDFELSAGTGGSES